MAKALPETWTVCEVQDVGGVVSGGTPSTKNAAYWGDEIPWISPADLTGYKNKFIERGAKSLSAEGLRKSSAKLMPGGSVHFSSRAPVGYVVISMQSLSTNQGFKSLVPADGVFNEYAYYYFKSIKQLAEQVATGTTFKELSGRAFSSLPFPLPPLKEQKRIVEKIEELFSEIDAGVASLRQALEQLGVYRQALLKKAFAGELTAKWRAEHPDQIEPAEQLLERIRQEREARYQQQIDDWKTAVEKWEASGKEGKKPAKPRPFKHLPKILRDEVAKFASMPTNWALVRLNEISDQITDGTHHTPKYQTTGVPFISVKDVRDDRVSFDACKYISKADHLVLCKRCQPEHNDLLITKSGTIGRLALVPNVEFSLFVSVALIKIQSSLHEISPAWFLNCMKAHFLSLNIDQDIKGGLLKNYHLEDLRLAVVPLCSLPEQKEIVRLLEAQFEAIEQNEREIDAALTRAEALRQSILKKAFSGQLVPQDPNDEPASVLLERIRAEREAAEVKKPKKKASKKHLTK